MRYNKPIDSLCFGGGSCFADGLHHPGRRRGRADRGGGTRGKRTARDRDRAAGPRRKKAALHRQRPLQPLQCGHAPRALRSRRGIRRGRLCRHTAAGCAPLLLPPRTDDRRGERAHLSALHAGRRRAGRAAHGMRPAERAADDRAARRECRALPTRRLERAAGERRGAFRPDAALRNGRQRRTLDGHGRLRRTADDRAGAQRYAVRARARAAAQRSSRAARPQGHPRTGDADAAHRWRARRAGDRRAPLLRLWPLRRLRLPALARRLLRARAGTARRGVGQPAAGDGRPSGMAARADRRASGPSGCVAVHRRVPPAPRAGAAAGGAHRARHARRRPE